MNQTIVNLQWLQKSNNIFAPNKTMTTNDPTTAIITPGSQAALWPPATFGYTERCGALPLASLMYLLMTNTIRPYSRKTLNESDAQNLLHVSVETGVMPGLR